MGLATAGTLLVVALAVALSLPGSRVPGTSVPRPVAAAAARSGDAEVGARAPKVFTCFQEQPLSLDPATATDAYSSAVCSQINSPLVGLTSSLEPRPQVAESWTVSRDGLTYLFQLRSDVRFHHGRPVTADDFVWSLTRLFREPQRSEGLASGYLEAILGVPEFLAGRKQEIEGIRALDRLRLEIRLSRPYGSLLSTLALDQTAPVPREILEAPNGSAAYAARPVGCGPFRFVRREGRHRLVLAADPEYFGGRPEIDSLVFLTPEGHVQTLGADALLRGVASMAEIPSDRLPEFRARPDITVLRWQDLSLSLIGMNTKSPPLDDPRVRRAIALAMNRQAMFQARPTGNVLAHGILPPGLPGYVPTPRTHAHDVAAARAALAAAGYGPKRPLPTITLVKSVGTPESRRIDTLMVHSLAEAGIRIRLHRAHWDEIDSLIHGRHAQLFGMGWVADIPDPDTFLRSLFHSRSATNYFQYSDPVVDSLLDVAAHTPNAETRSRAYRRVEQLVLDSAPVVPLFHAATFLGLRAEVQGLEMNPLGISTLAMERLTIGSVRDPSRQRRAGL